MRSAGHTGTGTGRPPGADVSPAASIAADQDPNTLAARLEEG